MKPLMLYLDFGSVHDAAGYQQTGPSGSFKVGGNFIRDDQDRIVAAYKNHCWQVGGKTFSRYDCKQAVIVHFEDVAGGKTDAYGPFVHPWVADGSAYCIQRLFAKFMDTTLLWHDHQTDTFWPWMVWTPAPSSNT